MTLSLLLSCAGLPLYYTVEYAMTEILNAAKASWLCLFAREPPAELVQNAASQAT